MGEEWNVYLDDISPWTMTAFTVEFDGNMTLDITEPKMSRIFQSSHREVGAAELMRSGVPFSVTGSKVHEIFIKCAAIQCGILHILGQSQEAVLNDAIALTRWKYHYKISYAFRRVLLYISPTGIPHAALGSLLCTTRRSPAKVADVYVLV